MFGVGDNRRMSMDITEPLPINSRALVVHDPSALNPIGQNFLFPGNDMQNEVHGQHVESVVDNSKKLQDELQEIGQKIKHHEDNVNYLKSLRNKLEDSILDMQVTMGKHHTTSFSKEETENNTHAKSEEETIQDILKYEKSAAALLCQMKNEAQVSDKIFAKDVVGVVATLGKVDDANLSRLLSEYLGLETMLAVVCRSYEGVKALESYTRDGLVNKGFGIHAFAAALGRPLDGRFNVICLENLRPYAGELVADDPQRRLNLLKPRLINGDTPPGFLGFAVNIIKIDNSNLYNVSKTGHTLRETLFYNLFSNLQVYKSREDMLSASAYITAGAVSLDGGMIRRSGIFSLGYCRGDMDVMFPCDSKSSSRPVVYYEIENRLKETKWKKDRALEDMQREQQLLDHVRFKYETKKRDFVRYLADSSSYATQHHSGRVSTPR